MEERNRSVPGSNILITLDVNIFGCNVPEIKAESCRAKLRHGRGCYDLQIFQQSDENKDRSARICEFARETEREAGLNREETATRAHKELLPIS